MGASRPSVRAAESDALLDVSHPVVSPVTGDVLEHVTMTTREGVAQALRSLPDSVPVIPGREVLAFLQRLREQLILRRERLFELTVFETGFIAADSHEIVDGVIEFLGDFETYVRELEPRRQNLRHSYSSDSSREMRITHRPLRAVAAVVPQNASLVLGVTILASALYAGTRVVLRPSLQGGATGSLLLEAVRESSPPESSVLIMNCLARDFLDACCASDKIDLIHHIGSNTHALSVFQQAFAAGKTCLIDGQGHGLLYVDESYPIPEAVRLITSAATRYNGETCTSTNGVLIQESIYRELKDALVDSFRSLSVGHPLSPDARIGPLFSEMQAIQIGRAHV
jgi:acyl-CoA reductase-like NAD-dependent aldehyde dehydrogenase